MSKHSTGQNGKGDARRPSLVAPEQVEKNWERIFGKGDAEKPEQQDQK